LPPINQRLSRLIEKKLAEPGKLEKRLQSIQQRRPDSRGRLWPKQPSSRQTARLRAEMIMKVRCGLLTARQAADRMGVSRKTFYKWEQRGLSALLDSVTDQPPGRPSHPSDDHRQWLEKQLQDATGRSTC
jgi:DNA invertase Pin-like site-specific DNA recombinase